MMFLVDAHRVLVTIKQLVSSSIWGPPTRVIRRSPATKNLFTSSIRQPGVHRFLCPLLHFLSHFSPCFAQIFVYIFHLSPPSVHFFSVAFLSWKISLLAFKSITCPLLDLSKVFLLNKLGDKSCVYFQDDETFYLKLKFFRNPCCLFLGLSHHDSLTRGFCQDFLLPKHVYSLINIWLEILPFKCVFSF